MARRTRDTRPREQTLRFRLLATAFRAVGRVHPEGAARLLMVAFSRTRRQAPSEGNRLTLAAGEPFTLRGPTGTLAGRRFGEGPTVLLLHGWDGRATQFASWVAPLQARGFCVVAFDAPGHGDSDGRSSHVGLLARGLEAVAARHGPVHGVVAHSLGAAATALSVRRAGVAPERLVFVAPSVRPAEFVRSFLATHLRAEAVEQRFLRKLEAAVGEPLATLDLPRLSLATPTLVIHDRSDDDVPFGASEALAQGWPGATLWPTEGLGHRRILHDPAVIAAGADFLAGRPPPAIPWSRARAATSGAGAATGGAGAATGGAGAPTGGAGAATRGAGAPTGGGGAATGGGGAATGGADAPPPRAHTPEGGSQRA